MGEGLRTLKGPDGMLAPFSVVNPTSRPIMDHEVHRARCRPVAERTPMPVAGQRVWYRHDWGAPLTLAQVESVDTSNKEDWNVYRYVLDYSHAEHRPIEVNGKRVMELVEDPWPDVVLRTEYGRTVTRESRIEGSPGWLPSP